MYKLSVHFLLEMLSGTYDKFLYVLPRGNFLDFALENLPFVGGGRGELLASNGALIETVP